MFKKSDINVFKTPKRVQKSLKNGIRMLKSARKLFERAIKVFKSAINVFKTPKRVQKSFIIAIKLFKSDIKVFKRVLKMY